MAFNYCLPPLDDVEPASFAMPALACDTHAHVISDDVEAYPFVNSRTYTPPAAPEAKYLAMLDRLGMQRGVLVQPSVYGTDNRYMLEVLSRHPQRLRGVAVVDATVSDKKLLEMHELGVRGLRINVLFGGGVGFDVLETLAKRIVSLGWHIQVLMDVRNLAELLPRLKKLPCPCVIDHMGHVPARLLIGSNEFHALLHLMSDYGWWVKLSGAYRISDDYPAYPDTLPLARRLIETAPDRVLWGSDWPHVAIKNMPNTGELRNLLAVWAPEPDIRRRILVDNPASLYGF